MPSRANVEQEGARERALRRYAPVPVPNLAETDPAERKLGEEMLHALRAAPAAGDVIAHPLKKGGRARVVRIRPLRSGAPTEPGGGEITSIQVQYRALSRGRERGDLLVTWIAPGQRLKVFPSDGSGIQPASNRSTTNEEANMATVVVRNTKQSGSKQAAKDKPAAAKSTAKPAAAAKAKAPSKASGVREKLLKESAAIAKSLREGTKMKDIKAKYGLSDDGPVRVALINSPAGPFNAKGVKTEYPEIKATGANLAKRLIKEREAGVAWYVLAFQTGKTEAELKTIVSEAGGEVKGRKYAPRAEGSTAGR